MTIKENYYEVPAGFVVSADGRRDECSHIQCLLTYVKNGIGFLSGKVSPRGYYMTIAPVKVKDGLITCNLCAAVKVGLVQCARQTAKKQKEAEALYNAQCIEQVKAIFPQAEIEFSNAQAA